MENYPSGGIPSTLELKLLGFFVPEASKSENKDLVCPGIFESLLNPLSQNLSICWAVKASNPHCVLSSLRPHSCWTRTSNHCLRLRALEVGGRLGRCSALCTTPQLLLLATRTAPPSVRPHDGRQTVGLVVSVLGLTRGHGL